MAAVEAQISVVLTLTEKLTDSEAPFAVDGNREVRHTGLNETLGYSASSTPAITKGCPFTVTLTAGAATLDLTAIPNPRGGTLDATGLKLRAILLKARSANTAAIVAAKGGTNGYTLGGSTFTIPVEPGCQVFSVLKDKAAVVGASAKNIGFTGAGIEAIDGIAIFG